MHSNKSPTLKPQHLLIYKIKIQLSIFLKEFELHHIAGKHIKGCFVQALAKIKSALGNYV